MEITIDTLSWDDFIARVRAFVPSDDHAADTRIDAFPAYQRILITRWLADAFVEPTPLALVEQLATLGEAYDWMQAALAAGQSLRSTPPTDAGSGASTRVRLRPILDFDLVPLYLASFDPANAAQWRYRGRTLPMDEFVATLFGGVIAQFMVEMVETGAPVGLVVAYDENRSGLNCKLAFLRCGQRAPGDSAAVLEGMMLFISYLFDNFPFRKLFAEVPSYNMSMFVADFADHEGVLKEFLFYKGEFVDLHHVSIARETWAKLASETGW